MRLIDLILKETGLHYLRTGEAFAGIGAWSKSLKNLNIPHELQFFYERDPFAANAFCSIHQVSETMNQGDITKGMKEELPAIDAFYYSPPCQTFSFNGKLEGIQDHRGLLFWDALEIIQAKQPYYAIMENVKGLVSKRFKETFHQMYTDLEEAGYINYLPVRKVLNTAHYGMPQHRERVYLVSIRQDFKQVMDSYGLAFNWPAPIPLTKSLDDFLENQVDPKYHLTEEQTQNFMKREKIQISRNKIIQIGDLNQNKHEKSNRVYSPKGVAPTLTTHTSTGRAKIIDLNAYRKTKEADAQAAYSPERKSCRINGKGLKHVGEPAYTITTKDRHGVVRCMDNHLNIRHLTPKECFRLQAFEDQDYEAAVGGYEKAWPHLKGKSDSQMYKRAGNTISVNVLDAIHRELLLKNEEHKNERLKEAA